MADFKKYVGFKGGKRSFTSRPGGDRPKFARKGNFGGPSRDRGDRDTRPQMFEAQCADCGNRTEVPFRPSGDRPVFCKNCFGEKRDRAPRQDFERRDHTRNFEKRAPFTPAQKPQPDPRIDDLRRQLESVMKKLDALTEMLEGVVLAKSDKVQKDELTKAVKKVVKKKAAKK